MGEAYLTSPLSTTSKRLLGTFSYSGSDSFSNRDSTYLSLDTHNIQNSLTTGFILIVVDLNFKGYVEWYSYPASFLSNFFISFGNIESLFGVSGPSADSSNTRVSFDINLKGELGAICQDSSNLIVLGSNRNYSGNSITAYAWGGNGSVWGSLSCTVSGTISLYKV